MNRLGFEYVELRELVIRAWHCHLANSAGLLVQDLAIPALTTHPAAPRESRQAAGWPMRRDRLGYPASMAARSCSQVSSRQSWKYAGPPPWPRPPAPRYPTRTG